MSNLKEIQTKKAETFQALETCSDELKPQLEQLYNDLDVKETLLMEDLDIDVD